MREAIAALMHSLNVMGGEKEKTVDMLDVFRMEHRTMQQSLMRVVVIPLLQHYAAQYRMGRTDGRNLASAKLAAKMLDAVTEDDLYIPFV